VSQSANAPFRRWIARGALAVGVAGAAAVVASAAPRDHSLVFWAEGRRITELRASVVRHADDEPFHGVTLRFDGDGRERVRHVVAVPHGDYVIHVTAALFAAPGARLPALETSVSRRVSLDGTETVILIPAESPTP
jgi:hypothetical protein